MYDENSKQRVFILMDPLSIALTYVSMHIDMFILTKCTMTTIKIETKIEYFSHQDVKKQLRVSNRDLSRTKGPNRPGIPYSQPSRKLTSPSSTEHGGNVSNVGETNIPSGGRSHQSATFGATIEAR